MEAVLIPWFRDYDPRVGRRERPRYTLCVSSQVRAGLGHWSRAAHQEGVWVRCLHGSAPRIAGTKSCRSIAAAHGPM